jgi:hypothetical protein
MLEHSEFLKCAAPFYLPSMSQIVFFLNVLNNIILVLQRKLYLHRYVVFWMFPLKVVPRFGTFALFIWFAVTIT